MSVIFGSDGFRSKFGEKYMTFEFISAFANSISNYCIKNELNPPVLIGRDTRGSGIVIENAIASVLNYTGIDSRVVGIIPTPGLSSILENNKYSLGIMITASHDPAANNGIKLFSSTGVKLDEESERTIEDNINLMLGAPQYKFNDKIGCYNHVEEYSEDYAVKIRNAFSYAKIPYKILVDCSNGACSKVAKSALKDYKTIEFIYDEPNGTNINLNCGAMEPENLLNSVRKHDFDYGVAFDGDGDRAIFVSSKYGIIETDKLIVLFANILYKNNCNKVVVSTEICNKGLEKNCENFGFKLLQAKVGDRNVVNNTLKNKGLIGAEPSGHYFFPKSSKTMDGLLALFHFIQLLQTYGDNFIGELKKLIHYYRVKQDVPVDDASTIVIEYLYERINSIIDNEKEKLVIRNSMWDPVIRIYYDYAQENNFNKINSLIAKSLKEILPLR